MIIEGIEISADFDLSEAEAKSYIDYVRERVKTPLKSIEVRQCSDGKVDVSYEAGEKFERIRRVTGYLTGSLDTWNDAKQAEERERVKHDGRF